MTDRITEYPTSLEVSSRISTVEFYVYESQDLLVKVEEGGSNWNGQYASFNLTAEEATRLKEFLIAKGY
jgi:hypothetical protein